MFHITSTGSYQTGSYQTGSVPVFVSPTVFLYLVCGLYKLHGGIKGRREGRFEDRRGHKLKIIITVIGLPRGFHSYDLSRSAGEVVGQCFRTVKMEPLQRVDLEKVT